MNGDSTAIKRNVLFAFIGAIVYYYIRKDAGEYFINKGLWELMIAAGVAVASQTTIWVSRYFMRQVTVNGFSGSIDDPPVYVTDDNGLEWAILNTGDYKYPVAMRGKLGTLVVPRQQLNYAGGSYVGTTFVRKFPLKFLPPAVYRYLMWNKERYNTDYIMFGMFAEDFKYKEANVSNLLDQIDNLNRQINMRNDLIEGRNDEITEMVEHAREVSGSNKKWYQVWKRPEEPPKVQ